ncbi:MAG: nucleotidyl transferase AbiEii/AbiGii toxin family protein [Elusimicrobia bacterium]|nr:nucleotidyl transferase AbiEii/AbiGii toxin family protein [Elusimicrobiota bacterium]
MDFERVFSVLRALEKEKVRYVLVGGVALTIHGLVRTTEDIDLFIEPEKDNVERIKTALRSVFSDPEIDKISADDLAGDYPTIRYVPHEEPFVIDIIARLGEAFGYDDLEAEERLIEGVRVRVATPATLYRMKKDTVRPIDRADAEALKRRFKLGEM